MKVIIKNFQSIEYCELEIPEKHFTVIVGPSNIGKSAIRRALECVLYNKSDSSYVRNGKNSCEVEILFEDGTHFKWSRTKKGEVQYAVNGENFDKLAKSVPQSIIDKGFYEIVANKEKYSVQIAPQFNNIFLLNQTGSKITEVLSNLGNLNRIINSNRICNVDLKNNKSKLSIRNQDIQVIKNRVKNYTGLDDQRNLVNSLKENFLEIKNIKSKLSEIIILSKSYDKITNTLKILSPLEKITVQHLDVDWNKFLNIKEVFQNYRTVVYRLNIYKDLPKKEINFELENQYKKYSQTVEIYSQFAICDKKVAIYKNLPDKIISLDVDTDRLKTMKEFYQSIVKMKQTILSIRKKQEEAKNKLNELQKEEKEIVDSN